MKKWRGDRKRHRPRKPGAPAEPEQPPLQPQDSEEIVGQDLSQSAAPAGSGPEVISEAGASAAGTQRSGRSRSRRRRKKPGAPPPAPAPPPEPLIPAYTDTEGPRAPSPVRVAAGAPTGEAGELDEPAELPPDLAPELGPEAPPPMAVPAPMAAPPAKPSSKGVVILSVGLPGSGKTTWFKRKGVTPLSSDLLRTLLFDDATEQRHQDLVFSSLRYLLRTRMMARRPLNYVDATNLSPKERRHWIRMAREFGYEVHAVYFDVSLETCLERNRKRQRIVPEDVMQRMSAKLRPPTFDEGFTKIVVVRVKHRPQPEAEAPAADAAAAAAEEAPEVETEEPRGEPE